MDTEELKKKIESLKDIHGREVAIYQAKIKKVIFENHML